jgi:catechol 2,3-dioxygenase-like lactoylglutathione lyase family enzyme
MNSVANPLVEELVARFDEGTLSRRQLLRGLTALAAAAGAQSAAAQTAPFVSTRIDHVSIQVTDMARSIEFYEKIFGLKVLSEDKENEIVRMGVTRIIVSLHRKAPVGIVDHFAIAIDGFDRETVTAELAKHGLTAQQNLDYGFYVRDPEGIPVQIVAT